MTGLKVTKHFFEDYKDRDFPTPEILGETARHYVLDGSDEEGVDSLLADALYYSDCSGGAGWMMGTYGRGIQASARATVRAIQAWRGKNNE